jgi:tol-pal system protein YbgF
MTRFTYAVSLTLLSFLLLIRCASRKEIVQFQEDIRYLKGRVDTLHEENRQLKNMIKVLNGSITQMEQEFIRTRADLLAEMSTIREQSQYIDNKLEDNISQISRYMKPPQSVRISSAQRDSLDSSLVKSDARDQQGSRPVMNPQQLYNTAYLDISKGNYGLARQGFQEFLRLFPESNLSDNAQYWLAESYYAENNYQQAISEFKKVIEDYPQGDKKSAALLKIGFSFQNLGDDLNARKNLNQVITGYPNSEEAKIARERLVELR